MKADVFKRIVRVVLCVVLLFVLVPAMGSPNVSAAGPSTLYVGGVNAMSTTSGSGWSYNTSSGTLKLNNATITGTYNNGGAVDYSIYSSGGTLTIELSNTSALRPQGDYVSAIYAEGGLTITGSGSLNAFIGGSSSNSAVIIKNGPFTKSGAGEVMITSDTSSVIGGVYGSYCDLIVTGGALYVAANSTSEAKSAIHAKDISVSGNGSLTAITKSDAYAINCNSLTANFAIGDTGYISARIDLATVSKKAINATAGVTITSGSVSPAGGLDTKEVRIEAPRPVPGAVGNLTAAAGDREVTLTWSVPTNTGGKPITGYYVYNSSNVKQNSSLITDTTYTVTGLTNGTIYSYYVKAVNMYGEGEPSNTVRATPKAVLPALTVSRAGGATGDLAVGETLTSSFYGGATPTATYRWQYALTDDALIWGSLYTAGSSTASFKVPKGYGGCYVRLSAVGTGAYSGQVFSNTLGPIAIAPIIIDAQPINSYVVRGSGNNASLTVSASTTEIASGKALSYRWVYGDNSSVTNLTGVSGGDTSTLTIAQDSINSHTTKRFKCIISYADGSGESVTTDTVLCAIGSVPQVTVQPSTVERTRLTTEESSFRYSLTLSSQGYPFTTRQWQYTSNPNDAVPTWNDITSAQGTASDDGYYQASFNTAATLPEGVYKFRCVVTNNYGTTTSNPTGLYSVLAPSAEPAVPSVIADGHYSAYIDGITYIRDDLTSEGSRIGYPLDNTSTAYDANTTFKVYSDEDKNEELTNVRATFDADSGKLILSSYPSGYLAEGNYFITAANVGKAQSIETTRFSIINKIHIDSVTGGYNAGTLYKGYPDSVNATINFNATEGADFNDGDTWTITLDSATGLTVTPSSGTFSGAGGNRTVNVTFSNTAATPAGNYRFSVSSDGYDSISGTVTVEDTSLVAHVSAPPGTGIGDGDGVGIIIQNEETAYHVSVTATPSHEGKTYQWQESSDSTDGTDGIWTDIPSATSERYSRTVGMSDSGHWFRCQVTSTVAGAQTMTVNSDAQKLVVRYPVNSNWLMVRNSNGEMVRVTEDTVLKPGDVLGFQLNAGYGYNGISGTESSFSHPGAQEICRTGLGMFVVSRGFRSYITYDIDTYTLTAEDIGCTVQFYHLFYTAAGTNTDSLYTSNQDISVENGARKLNHYSAYSPTVRGDLAAVSVSNNNGVYPAVAYGDTLTASISGTGATPTATYQWQVFNGTSWSDISGATSSGYTVGSSAVGKMLRVVATGSGCYDGTVTSASSDAVTRAVTGVTVNYQNPMIGDVLSATIEPADATVTYEWKANGATIGTGATYTVTANEWQYPITLVVTGSGNYTGSATDTTGAVTKKLTGITCSTDAPVTGSSITTTLSPAGATATYKWYTGTSASGPFAEITGAISSSYTPVASDIGLYIKVAATGSGDYTETVESTPYLVKTELSALNISSASADTATELDTTIAPAGATASYQWYSTASDTNSGGTAISGATGSTFTPAVAQMGKYVYCVATATGNYTGTAVSACSGPVTGAVLGVDVSSDYPILGTRITASELPAGASVTWKWYESSSVSGPFAEIAGATSKTFTPTQAQSGKYLKVEATGSGAFTGTKEHILTNAVAFPPTITGQPADESIISGKDASFSVTANGTSPLTYAWQISKDMGATWSNVAGGLSAVLNISGTSQGCSGELYRCVVSNSAGSVTSDSAELIVAESTLYHWVSGQDGKYVKGGSTGLPFRSDDTTSTATVDKLAFVYVDGELITEGRDYIASSGSVIITLNPSFLSTLSSGTHRLTAEFTDASTLVTKFTISPVTYTPSGRANPSTGVTATDAIMLALALLIPIGITAAIKRRKHNATTSR